MDRKYQSCTIELYQRPDRFNQWYARVSLGNTTLQGPFLDPELVFVPGDYRFEVPLNGPGKNKARAKVQRELHHRGIDARILDDGVKVSESNRKVTIK